MKAFGINQYGSSNVIEEFSIDIPHFGNNEVLVKTEAFAINPFDVAVREGKFKNSVVLLFPLILGTDAVGTIVKIGSKVRNFHVGDEIIAHAGYGTYAEYFSLSTDHLGLRPSQYDLYEAAGLPLSGITAYNVLVHAAEARANERIIVFGASGGVGSMIVQMAKAYGLSVIGVDRQSTKAYVLSLHVDDFISLESGDVNKLYAHASDIVVDATNKGLSAEEGLPTVKQGGRYISLTSLPPTTPLSKSIEMRQLQPQKESLDRDAFAAISLMIRNEQLHTRIDKVAPFTLEAIRESQDYVATKNHNGKMIISLNL